MVACSCRIHQPRKRSVLAEKETEALGVHALCALQVPQLEARDRVCWELVRQLAAVDLSSEHAVKQLMTAVVKSEAAVA